MTLSSVRLAEAVKPVPLPVVQGRRDSRKRADAATRAAELSTARIGNLQGRFVRALVRRASFSAMLARMWRAGRQAKG